MNTFKAPEGHETFEGSANVPKGGSWECQEPRCGKTTFQPHRWVVGATTTFACDSCGGQVKVTEALDWTLALEGVVRKVTLLEQQLIALHQRVTDQCGKG